MMTTYDSFERIFGHPFQYWAEKVDLHIPGPYGPYIPEGSVVLWRTAGKGHEPAAYCVILDEFMTRWAMGEFSGTESCRLHLYKPGVKLTHVPPVKAE
jgi:hypothetical protein